VAFGIKNNTGGGGVRFSTALPMRMVVNIINTIQALIKSRNVLD